MKAVEKRHLSIAVRFAKAVIKNLCDNSCDPKKHLPECVRDRAMVLAAQKALMKVRIERQIR